MVDEGALPPWGLNGLARDWAVPPPWGHVVALGLLGGLAGAVAGVSLTDDTTVRVGAFVLLALVDVVLLLRFAPLDLRPLPTREVGQIIWSALLLTAMLLGLVTNLGNIPALSALLFGVFGVALGVVLSYPNAARWARREARDPDEAGFAAASPTSIRDAPPGRVRVAGSARVRRAAILPDGGTCAAYERRTSTGNVVSIQSGGGVLELDDGSGAPARVVGEWVRVLDGSRIDALAVLADGADAEVVGEGRWVTDDDAGNPMRGGLRVLEITGSRESPVLLRTVRRSAEATSRVRVAATPTGGHEGAEPATGAPGGPARKAARQSEGAGS